MKLAIGKALLISGIVLAIFFFPQKIFAARSMTISSSQSVIHGYDDMTITVASMSGFTNGETIYVKGAFYKDGSTNYFGYTKNGDTLVKNGDSTTNQKQIQIGSWDGSLVVESDFADSGFTNYGEGDYKLKVGFYYLTSSGSISLVNWSTNSLDITINDPDPTPTPTNPPSTNTPIPTLRPTATPSPLVTTFKPSATIFPTNQIASGSGESTDSEVLGSSISAEPTLVQGEGDKKVTSVNFVALFLIIGGIFVLSSCGILFYYQRKKQLISDETHNE